MTELAANYALVFGSETASFSPRVANSPRRLPGDTECDPPLNTRSSATGATLPETETGPRKRGPVRYRSIPPGVGQLTRSDDPSPSIAPRTLV